MIHRVLMIAMACLFCACPNVAPEGSPDDAGVTVASRFEPVEVCEDPEPSPSPEPSTDPD